MATQGNNSKIIQVDDGHPFVYSSGDWNQQPMNVAFNRTVSYTYQIGSIKMVRFRGTSITVRGGLQPYANTPNRAPNLQFLVDNKTAMIYTASSPQAYSVVDYYRSPDLPMGVHVLNLTNLADIDIIHVDSFLIHANDGGQPDVLPWDGSQITPSATTSLASNTGAKSLPMASSGLASSLEIGNPSASGVSISQLTSSIVSASMTGQSASTKPSTHFTPDPIQQPTTTDQPTATDQSQKAKGVANPSTHKTIIVAAVAGTLVILLIGTVLTLTIRRWFRRKMSVEGPNSNPRREGRDNERSASTDTGFLSAIGKRGSSLSYVDPHALRQTPALDESKMTLHIGSEPASYEHPYTPKLREDFLASDGASNGRQSDDSSNKIGYAI